MIELKSLRNNFISQKQNEDIRLLLSSIIVDRGMLKNNCKLFYNEIDKQTLDNFRVVDDKMFVNFKPNNWKNFQFEADWWLIKEFFNNRPFNIELPVCLSENKKQLRWDMILKYFLWPLAKEKVIDDLLFTILRNIITVLWLYYDADTREIWFWNKQLANRVKISNKYFKYKVKEISLEEVLAAEIQQWFVSKLVWDEYREYWYTHLLRQHAQYKLFNWSKNVLINWNKYNVLATSRSYGKCQHKNSRIMLSDWSYKFAKDMVRWDKIMWSNYKEQIITNIDTFKKETLKISLDNWMTKIVTTDHRMPTVKNFNNWYWDINDDNYKHANELSIWEKIPVAFNYETFRNDFDKEDIMIYWYFLWDWCKWNNIIHWNHDRLLDIVNKYKITKNKLLNHNSYRIHWFKQNNIFEWIDNLALDKYIDSRIFSQSKELKFKFLEWLFNTDSYLHIKPFYIEYCSVSEILINQLNELLYSLWITSYIKKKKIKSNFKTNNEYAFYLYISNSFELEYLLWNIDLSSKKNYKIFLEWIKWKLHNSNIWTIPLESFNECNVKSKTIKWQSFYNWIRKPRYDYQRWKLKNYNLEHWWKYSWHKIVNIDFLWIDDVISIEVSNNDSLYFSNWILSHNTMFGAFIWARWLLDPRPWFAGRKYREIKIFVPDKENIWNQYMSYIKSMIWDLKNIKLENWLKAFEFSQWWIKCNITWNVLKIISLNNIDKEWKWELGTSRWEWLACDLAIIDEAARIPDRFWISFHQRAAFETQEFLITSTINEETPVDHWFYQLLIDWETWDEKINSYRLDIENNEAMKIWKTDEEWKEQLESVKATLRKWWDREFYAKWYCIILEESNVFNIQWQIVTSNEKKYSDNDIRVLWFDLWKLDDSAALILINLTHREIEEARPIYNATYGMQLQYAEEYKKKYKNIFIIWDRSWVWEAVSEQDTKWVVDCWIKSTWVWWLSYNKKYWYYTCSKWLIISTLSTIFNLWILKIPSSNELLIEQLNNFVKMKSWRWETILYKWKWKTKDDLVLATAYAWVYIYLILGLKTIKHIDDYVKSIWINETYLYNEQDYNYNNNYYNWLY